MSSSLGPAGHLDADRDEPLGGPWWRSLERALGEEPAAWAVVPLSAGRAWTLLGWAETAATVVLREQRPELLVAAVQGLALQEGGPLDRRDVMVIGDLLARAAQLTGLDFPEAVTAGAARAGARGADAVGWLTARTGRCGDLWVEQTLGPGPRFVRRGGRGPDDPVRVPPVSPLRTATIEVRRPRPDVVDSYDRHDALVRVDGGRAGRLPLGGTLRVPVVPGGHEVRVRLRFNPNRARVGVHVSGSGTVTVVCEKTRPARLSLPPSRYWRLRVTT